MGLGMSKKDRVVADWTKKCVKKGGTKKQCKEEMEKFYDKHSQGTRTVVGTILGGKKKIKSNEELIKF